MPSAANLHHVHPKCPDCTAARRPTALRQLGNGVPPRRDASLPLVRFLLDGDARSSFISDQANLRWLARLGDFGRLNWFAVSPTSGLPPSRSIARCLLKISTTAESGQDGKHTQSRYVQSPSMPSCSVLSPYPPVRTPPTRQARSRWRIQMLKEQKALTAGSFPFPLRSMNETAPEVTEPPPPPNFTLSLHDALVSSHSFATIPDSSCSRALIKHSVFTVPQCRASICMTPFHPPLQLAVTSPPSLACRPYHYLIHKPLPLPQSNSPHRWAKSARKYYVSRQTNIFPSIHLPAHGSPLHACLGATKLWPSSWDSISCAAPGKQHTRPLGDLVACRRWPCYSWTIRGRSDCLAVLQA